MVPMLYLHPEHYAHLQEPFINKFLLQVFSQMIVEVREKCSVYIISYGFAVDYFSWNFVLPGSKLRSLDLVLS